MQVDYVPRLEVQRKYNDLAAAIAAIRELEPQVKKLQKHICLQDEAIGAAVDVINELQARITGLEK